MAQTAHDFSFEDVKGAKIPLAAYQGKVVLVVNTATKCGFSVQYGPLRTLQDRYGKQGFTIIGVPSDDFNQEPLDGDALVTACQVKFLANYPITGKTHVKGEGIHPFYKWARAQGNFFTSPRHNFHKYLIGPSGELLDWYSAVTSPTSNKIIRQIERALGK